MSTKAELKLEQVLRNNPLQPLVLAGKGTFEGENCLALSATTDERELHIPSGWHKQLDLLAQTGKVYLLIEGMGEIAASEQDKFAGLLKDRRAGNYKLPDNAQIIIPVKDIKTLSNKIQTLALVWDAK